MSKFTNLDKMSYKDLVSLRDRIATTIVARQAADKIELKRKLEEMASEAGFDFTDLFGARRPRKGGKIAVKYRNPKDPAQTWTGRGRKPNWLVEALGKGQKIESFLAE